MNIIVITILGINEWITRSSYCREGIWNAQTRCKQAVSQVADKCQQVDYILVTARRTMAYGKVRAIGRAKEESKSKVQSMAPWKGIAREK